MGKKEEKQAKAKVEAEREARNKIPPQDLFRSIMFDPNANEKSTSTDASPQLVLKYSQFDENGIPTHDHLGEEIPKNQKKKLTKEWENQKKNYAKYLKKIATEEGK